MSVVMCTALRGKELHRHVGVGIVVMSGSLFGEMVVHWFESHNRHNIFHFRHTHDMYIFMKSSFPKHDIVIETSIFGLALNTFWKRTLHI